MKPIVWSGPEHDVASSQAAVNVRADVYDARSGELLSSQQVHNLVVKSGLNLLKSAIATGSCVFPTHFAFGTSNTAVTAADTALGAELSGARDLITNTAVDATDPTITYQYYLPATGTAGTACNGHTVQEVGLFTGSPTGTMYARVVLASPIVKTNLIAVSFTWTLTWAAVS